MTEIASPSQRTRFYRAALLGLVALDATESAPRRFGSAPDARWASFAGHLRTTDRIDLLVRDAAVRWAAAFSPAQTFGLHGLADDEPFGPDWTSLPEPEAQTLWNEVAARPSTSINDLARALGVERGTVALPPIVASTRLFVAGGAALCAVAEHFQANPELSWSDQVLAVAEAPNLRQLAGLVAALLRAQSATRLVWPGVDVAKILKAADFSRGGQAVTSPDASAAALDFVRATQGS